MRLAGVITCKGKKGFRIVISFPIRLLPKQAKNEKYYKELKNI